MMESVPLADLGKPRRDRSFSTRTFVSGLGPEVAGVPAVGVGH